MIKRNKKAFYYSIDALIAVTLIFAILFVVKPISKQKTIETNLQDDTIQVLSSLKISEINNSYVKELISEGKVSGNNTLLEQIAEFYARGMPEAKLLAGNIFSDLNPKENIGIWFDNELIASSNKSSFENSKDIFVARQIVSGVEKPEPGGEIKGYSARAFLTHNSQVNYFYFGGYIGDGNISIKADYSGTLNSAVMDIAINKNFSLYINGNFSGNFQKTTPVYTPQEYILPLTHFNSNNIIELRGNNLYIAGGYIKLTYNASSSQTKKYLPGISGLINIFDSFYVPSSLSSMEISLHYNSPYQLFLNIGNKTVYEGNGTKTEIITNSQLSSMLDYSDLTGKTVPLRLGLYEMQSILRRGNADVVLITDLSGSMDSRMDNDNTGTTRNCNDPNIYTNSTKRLSLAKCLDKMFVDMILNVSGNRVALSAFYGDKDSPFKGRVYEENLTSNATYLKSKIDAYSPQGGTCICCSENDAYKILYENSSSSKYKFVIVMSDGIPTHTCQANNGCTGIRTGLHSDEGLWLGYGAGCYGGLDDCNVNDCECASTNANWSSCRLKTLNSTVYSIGFGPVSSCDMANKTLKNIANCGNGKYYASQDPNALLNIYAEIANEILSLSFIEQVSNVSQNFSLTTLYPDSYISTNYQSSSPYGLIATSETSEFGNDISTGSFDIPQDSTPMQAIAVSYSGSRWTDKVTISNNVSQVNIFNLSYYGSDYLGLGDPYFIYIPAEKISRGQNNVTITTGLSPANSSGGSSSDKVIFTIVKNVSGYSPIKPVASGCIWFIEFEDSTNTTIKVPGNYSGTNECYFTSGPHTYNENDAINYAVHDLLKNIDFDSDNRADSKFSEQDLVISENEVSGIPYPYNSEVQVRVWR